MAEFIKYATEDVDMILYALFNVIFDKEDWPDDWALGIINPLHKRESLNVPDNYRKIKIMPVLGKLLELILNTRLKIHSTRDR